MLNYNHELICPFFSPKKTARHHNFGCDIKIFDASTTETRSQLATVDLIFHNIINNDNTATIENLVHKLMTREYNTLPKKIVRGQHGNHHLKPIDTTATSQIQYRQCQLS